MMFVKDQLERATILEVSKHDWITRDGTEPLLLSLS